MRIEETAREVHRHCHWRPQQVLQEELKEEEAMVEEAGRVATRGDTLAPAHPRPGL